MSYPQNDFRDYLEHSVKGQTWKNHKYIRKENGRYIYPEDVRVNDSSLRNRRNAMEMPIVNAKVKRKKSKLGNVLGRLINRPNGRIVSDLNDKASKRDIEKRRRKLWDNEKKRLIKKRKAEEEANSIKVQHIVDDMAVKRNSNSLRKPRRRSR